MRQHKLNSLVVSNGCSEREGDFLSERTLLIEASGIPIEQENPVVRHAKTSHRATVVDERNARARIGEEWGIGGRYKASGRRIGGS